MALSSLAMIGAGLPSGFLFGTGYGAGVRFGYEDVYPYLKANMGDIAKILQIPFASSGFKLASGVTEHQGMGLQDAEASTGKPQSVGSVKLNTPENISASQTFKGIDGFTGETFQMSNGETVPYIARGALVNPSKKLAHYAVHEYIYSPKWDGSRGKTNSQTQTVVYELRNGKYIRWGIAKDK